MGPMVVGVAVVAVLPLIDNRSDRSARAVVEAPAEAWPDRRFTRVREAERNVPGSGVRGVRRPASPRLEVFAGIDNILCCHSPENVLRPAGHGGRALPCAAQ